MPLPKSKKKKSSKLASRDISRPVALGEGTSNKPNYALGPTTSVLGSRSMTEKILAGVILPVDKEKVDKLSLD